MFTKRIRIFAGPNGSGKTTIVKKLQAEIPFGVYVNADDIEKNLVESHVLIFDTYQLIINEKDIQQFFKISTFSPTKRNEPNLYKYLTIKNNTLHVNTNIDSYLAADLAEFIRQQLLLNNISFSYETVMSNINKIDFIQKAKNNNYKIYLYYISTEDPSINIKRVKIRVAQNGHPVDSNLIIKRYYNSLKLLKSAVKLSDRAFIWDNSKDTGSVLVSEITNGTNANFLDIDKVPTWLKTYLFE